MLRNDLIKEDQKHQNNNDYKSTNTIIMKTLFTTLFCFSVFILAAGCDSLGTANQIEPCEEPPAELAEESLTYFDGLPYSKVTIVQNAEHLQNELSNVFAGFGGVWRDPSDTNQFVLGVTDMDDFEARKEELLEEIKVVFDENNQSYSSITPTEVEFSFTELQYARDLLVPVLHQRDDIAESFLDIESNRISIGILEGANQAEYHDILNTYCISTGMITMFETGPAHTASW